MKGRFDTKEVDKLCAYLLKNGYDILEIQEGSLGYGYTICVPPFPDCDWYNYIITEHYVNEWCSDHSVRRRKKLSKADQKLVDNYYAREESEVVA